MFQFRAFPSYAYLIQRTIHRYCLCGFPHSEICGSTLICSYPQLIAACHVLRRLLMPRHSPCALFSLTSRRISAHALASVLARKLVMFAGSSSFELNPFHWASIRAIVVVTISCSRIMQAQQRDSQNCIHPNLN